MASWRVAKSLDQLLRQINAKFPNRDKSSDGSIGDAAHASRSSDHNPWVKAGGVGIVTARDFTNDPIHGFVSQALADKLIASRDERIKYIISNKMIVSGTGQGKTPWQWRKYTGSNPHDKHVHVSVKSEARYYDDDSPWGEGNWIVPADASAVPEIPPARPVLRLKSTGPYVKLLQKLLNDRGDVTLMIDGDFGPKTETAVKAVQKTFGLVVDGVVGPYTWQVLETH